MDRPGRSAFPPGQSRRKYLLFPHFLYLDHVGFSLLPSSTVKIFDYIDLSIETVLWNLAFPIQHMTLIEPFFRRGLSYIRFFVSSGTGDETRCVFTCFC